MKIVLKNVCLDATCEIFHLTFLTRKGNDLEVIQKVHKLREGGTLKAYENVLGERGGDFSPHISMIKQVSNLLISSSLARSTHYLVGFKSMTCK